MNLTNKLEGLPTVYYFNLDDRKDRKDYMESQFDHFEIKNFVRISSSIYDARDFNIWKEELLELPKNYHGRETYIANFLNHIKTIKKWLETTEDEYLILMEDDYDLSLIKYWNFDWNYLMSKLPYDWDCIMLGFESVHCIHFFLHPKLPWGTFFGPCLINRNYAKKIVSLHMKNDKLNMGIRIADNLFSKTLPTVDYAICSNGRTYCIPLITCYADIECKINEDYHIRPWHFKSKELYYDWWQNEHHKFKVEDFFIYNKSNDYQMTKFIEK